MLKKYLNGNTLKFNIDFNPQLPKALSSIPNISLSSTSLTPPSIPNPADKFKLLNTNVNAKHYLGQLGSQLIDYGSQVLSNGLFGDDSEVGRAVGGAMSGTLGSVGNTLLDNFIKGNTLYEGLGKNAISGASGALGGLAASQVGKGITSIMGDSNLGRFTGGAASSALGQILGGGVGNPINFASNALGAGLSAMTGPSKEYGGKYGNVTQTMDSIYGTALGVVGMMGPVGAAISAGMALNKGLSNIFGSTSGMTKQDAILGSAFMPAPVKWLNMAGAETTDTLKNLSWQNSEKTNTFMLNAFGNLQAKLDDARDKAGKTYGTFSRGSYRDAQNAIDFANDAYGTLLAMADLNELQKIRSLYMTSINNLRYAQNIQGGWSPLAIGKQGMKIFNNATNHNMGMRLLSAAALIDNKQMILSFLGGGTPRYLKHKKPAGGAKKFRALTQEELDNRTPEITVTPVTQRTPEELNEEWERTHPNGGNADPNLSRVSDLTSGIFNLTTKPPFTGQEYQQAIEAQRLKKLDRFHEAEEIGEAALMADLAVSAAPLLLRGFRWAFNKAGLLIKVPKSSIKIVPKNATNITPEQWTAAQDAAIARGDMAETQRLRDLHFKVNTPNSVTHDVFHHGNKKPMDWYIFDPARVGTTDEGYSGAGYYFAPTRTASQYAKEHLPHTLGPHGEQNAGLSGGRYHRYVYLNGETKYKPLGDHDWTTHTDLPFVDNRPIEVVVGDNRQIKLADAVTYDNNGVRIPLGSRDNFNINDIRYYESPNKKAMKGVKYIELPPSATSLDAEQQLAQRLESYTPKAGENGLIEYKPLNSSDVINIPEEAIEKQIQRFVDSGMERESAIEYLREQFGYGAMTQNGKTFLLPEKYMITNPEYMKAHDAVHRVLRFDDSFSIPGAEGLNPNEAVAMISGEIKPALGIQANEPLTEEMLNKWLITTNNKITGRYGFSSKIKDKKKFLEWANKVAPVMLPSLLGGSTAATLYNNK